MLPGGSYVAERIYRFAIEPGSVMQLPTVTSDVPSERTGRETATEYDQPTEVVA